MTWTVCGPWPCRLQTVHGVPQQRDGLGSTGNHSRTRGTAHGSNTYDGVVRGARVWLYRRSRETALLCVRVATVLVLGPATSLTLLPRWRALLVHCPWPNRSRSSPGSWSAPDRQPIVGSNNNSNGTASPPPPPPSSEDRALVGELRALYAPWNAALFSFLRLHPQVLPANRGVGAIHSQTLYPWSFITAQDIAFCGVRAEGWQCRSVVAVALV